MAFTIENNMPSAGNIRWASLNMQYKGTNYAITNGYTNYIYVYWAVASPTVLVVSNVFPTLGIDDCLIFLNKSGIAVVVPNSTVISGDIITPGTILAANLAANTITGDRIAATTIAGTNLIAGTISATQIAANAIGASAISANVITGDKLVVDAITAREIAALTITATQMVVGTITAASGIIADAAITSAKIATLVADKIQGGTLTLGGVNNTSGVFVLKNNLGSTVFHLDNLGFWSESGNIAIFNDSAIIDYLSAGGLTFTPGQVCTLNTLNVSSDIVRINTIKSGTDLYNLTLYGNTTGWKWSLGLNGTNTTELLKFDVTNQELSGSCLNLNVARQALINGNFDIWQRLPAVDNFATNIADGNYGCADRWMSYIQASGGTLPTSITYWHKRLGYNNNMITDYLYILFNNPITNIGAGAHGLISQKIENGTRLLCGSDESSLKKVTVSMRLCGSTNKKVGVYLRQNYGTGGSPSAMESIAGSYIVLTDAIRSLWNRYTWTFTTNTLVGKTFGTDHNDYLEVMICYIWGAGGADSIASNCGSAGVAENVVNGSYVQITQVQLNAGASRSPFMPKSFAEELKDCQRYYEKSCSYWRIPGSDNNIGAYGSTYYSSGNGSIAVLDGQQFKVVKRVISTMKIYGGEDTAYGEHYMRDDSVGGALNLGSSYYVAWILDTGFRQIIVGGTGATNFVAGHMYGFDWSADAEL